jgi:GTP-binding protein HflX
VNEEDAVSRVLGRAGTALNAEPARAEELDQLELEARTALRRVAGLSTELEDIHELEYRSLRLERVVLVGLFGAGVTETQAEVSLRELAALAQTAGSQVLDALLQRRTHPDPATYLGSGKAQELADLVAANGADTVIVDAEISPSQRRGLEDVAGVKVVDRTALILDIFAAHAASREGKAQVELAQLSYLLPRLRGWGESMSRQAGGRVAGGAGIGSRGPGETKIELDRRRIRARIARLRRDIAQMEPARATKRRERRRSGTPAVAIIGYTNAGKSSLLNALTGSAVLVDNALFATLDPTVRQARTDDGRVYTLADTVGFVRNLPHQLVAAFRSTLEESIEADVHLHVVDAAHVDPEGQIQAVHEVLKEIEVAGHARELLVFNKIDIADSLALLALRGAHPGAVFCSVRSGEGLDELRLAIADALPMPRVEVDLVVPFARGDLVSRVHTEGQVLAETYLGSGTKLHAFVGPALAADLQAAAEAAPEV